LDNFYFTTSIKPHLAHHFGADLECGSVVAKSLRKTGTLGVANVPATTCNLVDLSGMGCQNSRCRSTSQQMAIKGCFVAIRILSENDR
jgi:hypothetical protein